MGTDLFQHEDKQYIIFVDYYSGFIQYEMVKSTGAMDTLAATRHLIRTFGKPATIISDNGTNYTSKTYKDYLQEMGVDHKTSSPHFPQGNGRAERAVGTLKSILKKVSNQAGRDKAILAYLDTPISDKLPTPTQLFMGRRLRTDLPILNNLVKNIIDDEDMLKIAEHRSKHLKSRDERKFGVGDSIYYTDKTTKTWHVGKIMSKDEFTPESYILQDESGSRLRRNAWDIKERSGSGESTQIAQAQQESIQNDQDLIE